MLLTDLQICGKTCLTLLKATDTLLEGELSYE